MPISTNVQEKIESIDKLILDATSMVCINPATAKDKLASAQEQLERLAIDQRKNITEYSQYDLILTAWNSLSSYDHKYH